MRYILALLLLVPCAQADDTFFFALTKAHEVGMHLDWASTAAGTHVGISEWNKYARWHITKPRLSFCMMTLAAKSITLVAREVYKENKLVGTILMCVLVAVRTYVVVDNFKLLARRW